MSNQPLCILSGLTKHLTGFQCGVTRVFQTGTPFCAKHLRNIFMIDARYDEPRKQEGRYCSSYGPYLVLSPGASISTNCIIFPSYTAFAQHKAEINPYVLDWMNDLTRKHRNAAAYAVCEVIKNWGSLETGAEKDQATKCAIGERDSVIKAIDDMQEHLSVMRSSKFTQTSSLFNIPRLLGFAGIHMCPSVVLPSQNSENFEAFGLVSNVKYDTNKGYIAKKNLVAAERLVLEVTSLIDSSQAIVFHHRRETTAQDSWSFGIDSLEQAIRRANPVPVFSYETLQSAALPASCLKYS
ncbi:hypothetical protein HDE_04248 [Halotydeus destructor]|nr:hypothetical protein HDE_04248 [Halotydeus destructor]